MGGIFGKPNTITADVVSEVINQSILKLASDTTSNNTITQLIEANEGSTVSGSTQYAEVKTNMASVVTATQNSNFETQLKSDVSQELEKKSVALFGAADGLLQNNNTDLNVSVTNRVSNLNLTELTPICATNNSITQSMVAKKESKIIDSSQTVKAEFMQSCSSMVDQNMGTMSDIANAINQRAKITLENPLDFLRDVFSGGFMMIAVIIVSIVVGFVVLVGPGKLDATSIIREKINPNYVPPVTNTQTNTQTNTRVITTPVKTSVNTPVNKITTPVNKINTPVNINNKIGTPINTNNIVNT
jgi:hypothetical protein